MLEHDLNSLGTQRHFTDLPVSTVAWLLGSSVKVVRSRLDQFVGATGEEAARMNGGTWAISVDAVRRYMNDHGCPEEQLMMLERAVGRTAIVPPVPRSGPPPPLSKAILALPKERSR